MAIQSCRECGENVSSDANACPKCGAPSPTSSPRTFWIKCFVIALCIILAPIILAGSHSTNQNKTSTSHQNEPYKIDVTRPIYTKEQAIICPSLLFFEKQHKYSPKAIGELFNAFINIEEKAEKAGCQIWKDGIPVYLAPSQKDDNGPIIFRTEKNGLYLYFTFRSHLRNDPEPKKDQQTSKENIGAKNLANCTIIASKTYDIPVPIIIGVLHAEGGIVGEEIGPKEDKTYRLGPMRINSAWVPELAKEWGVSNEEAYRLIRDDGCVNIRVGTWILHNKIFEAGTINGGLASYPFTDNSKDLTYAEKVTNILKEKKLLIKSPEEDAKANHTGQKN